jgi:hypothetical protein
LSSEQSESKQVKDYYDSLINIIVPSTISVWLEKVVKSANEICGNSMKDTVIRYDRSVEKENYFKGIKIPPNSSKKSVKCLIMAIDEHISNAPDLIKAILYSYRKELEGRLQDLET